MLSPQLLELLRDWWVEGRRRGVLLPRGWLFPGRNPIEPLSTRQLNRAVHAAADAAGIKKRVSPHTLRHSFATHLLEQNIDIRVIQVLLGHAKLDTTALYTRVANTTIRNVTSPLDRLAPRSEGRPRPGAWPGGGEPPEAGGRRRLSSLRSWLAPRQCRASQPRPAPGDVGRRELPLGRPRRARRALRRLRPQPDRLQLVPQPPLPQVPGRGGTRTGLPRARPICCRSVTSTWSSPSRPRSPRSPTRTRRWSMTCCSAPQRRRCSPLPPIPDTSGPASAPPPCSIAGARQ